MSFEQEKMIVGSLPSLYPLQKFEEEAVNALVSIQIDDDTISRKAVTDAIEKCHKKCCREDATGDEWIHYETTLNEVESIPPAPTTEVATDINVGGKDIISRKAAIEEIERWLGYIDDDMVRRMQIGMKRLPPAQPELIEKAAYIRGFEQGRTQGMIDSQGGKK